MTTSLTIGFVPLADATLLVAAREGGFARAQGLDLHLQRETSWAAIRDKLNIGHFDAAQMLAPAAIASTAGIGHVEVPLRLISPLGLNGNAVTLCLALASELEHALDGNGAVPPTPRQTAHALLAIARRRAKERRRLTCAVVFTHCAQLCQVRHWLMQATAEGEDPLAEIDVVVIPPPYMVDSLALGQIDFFCAGAPWNLLAQGRGVGRVLHRGATLMPDCPDKLLVARQTESPPDWAPALAHAIADASAFATDPANRATLTQWLARPDYLGLPQDLIARVLDGRVPTLFEPADTVDPDYLRLDPQALALARRNLPDLAQAMVTCGQIDDARARMALDRLLG
jgi:NitT/TauT family transport system ATP-binding protein